MEKYAGYILEDFEIKETRLNNCEGCFFTESKLITCWHKGPNTFIKALFNQHENVKNGNCTRLVAKLKTAV